MSRRLSEATPPVAGPQQGAASNPSKRWCFGEATGGREIRRAANNQVGIATEVLDVECQQSRNLPDLHLGHNSGIVYRNTHNGVRLNQPFPLRKRGGRLGQQSTQPFDRRETRAGLRHGLAEPVGALVGRVETFQNSITFWGTMTG